MAFTPDNQSLLASHGTNLLTWQLSEPHPRLIAEMDDTCLAIGSLQRADGSAVVVTGGADGLVLWAL